MALSTGTFLLRALAHGIDSGGERDWKRDARNTFMRVSLEVKYNYLTPLFLF